MRILAGGSRLAWAKRGFYMEPTALLASSNRDRICQDEIFGPVATFLTFDTMEEAVRIANDSAFGLAAYVWSNDLAEVADLTEAIQAGTIWVNTPMVRDLRSAFGGYKESGFGREGGRSALDFYTEAKSVIVARGPRQLPRFGAVKP
jgi:acyl-CoA reductase-like NAD-dependent aldehyde dehydrogenase